METGTKRMTELLKASEKFKASDIHLKVGSPPIFRVSGTPQLLNAPPLSGDEVEELAVSLLTDDQKVDLKKNGAVDISYSVKGVARFRINIYRQRGAISLAARRVQTHIPNFEELHLPPAVAKVAEHYQGLIILSGVTGSGKSTTIAAMIQHINQTRRCHILTVEDPIEYLFKDDKSFINQREIGVDTPGFEIALKHMVREDPDVVLIGEMRDEETFMAGLAAAETGHLVLGTLHSSTAASTFGRILEFFPSDRHDQVRSSMVFNLRAIVCQRLLPSIKEGVPRVPAVEIMLMSPIMRKLIREGEDDRISDVMRASEQEGMQDFNSALTQLVHANMVAPKTAFEYSPNADALRMLLKGIRVGVEGILT